MIEIKITADNPLEALANLTAYGILCMENREVFDRAGTILAAARSKQPAPVDNSAATTHTPDPVPTVQTPPIPPTMPPASPSTAPIAPTVQSQGGSAAGVSPGSTIPSNPAPAAGVPVASAPTYTMEQIAKAGAELLSKDPNMRDQLMALLAQHGVQSMTELSPAQYGAYATALRGMGAKI